MRTFGIIKWILHSLRDDMVDRHPSKSIVNLGSASVNNVSSKWQSTMSSRKECNIYIMSPSKLGNKCIVLDAMKVWRHSYCRLRSFIFDFCKPFQSPYLQGHSGRILCQSHFIQHHDGDKSVQVLVLLVHGALSECTHNALWDWQGRALEGHHLYLDKKSNL